jgi:hypothetical protein
MTDRVLDATVIHAYAMMNQAGPAYPTDKIICNPEVRNDFLFIFRSLTVTVYTEEKILRRLLGLRKAKLLPTFTKIKKESEPQ